MYTPPPEIRARLGPHGLTGKSKPSKSKRTEDKGIHHEEEDEDVMEGRWPTYAYADEGENGNAQVWEDESNSSTPPPEVMRQALGLPENIPDQQLHLGKVYYTDGRREMGDGKVGEDGLIHVDNANAKHLETQDPPEFLSSTSASSTLR